MSRTIRKQSGNRWWKEINRSKSNFHSTYIRTSKMSKYGYAVYASRPIRAWAMTWEEIEKEAFEATIKNERKDGYWWDSISRNVKWHSNKMVRQGNRKELHRVMKDPENHDYNRDHDLRKKGLWWKYD